MKKEVLKEVLATCKKENSLDELVKVLSTNEYRTDEMGKTVKIQVYKDRNGEVKTDILDACDYKDINKMSIEQLETYLKELQKQYSEMESEEPEEDSEEFIVWEENLEEIVDEIDSVKEKLKQMNDEVNK